MVSGMLKLLALSVIAFLTTMVFINFYEVTYQAFVTPLYSWIPFDSKRIGFPALSSANKGTEAEDYIGLQTFYEQAMKKGIGRMGGPRMNISLLSAFEHPDRIYVMMTSLNKYGDTVYCRYFDSQRREIGPAFKTVVFPEFTAQCLRREGTKYISLSDEPMGLYECPVPITDRTQNVVTHNFSACLAPLYGAEPKWLWLAEFIEHHKIQGATYFYIYVKELDSYSRMLLDDYVRTGEAEVIVLHDRFVRDDKLWQLPELQDCLTRARGHSQWVAMIDLDERLTPTQYRGTLSDYLRKISDPTIAEVSFRQRWIPVNETFPDKYISRSQVAEWMPTWRYQNTSHVAPRGYTAKYIADPNKTIIANVHAIDLFFSGYKRYFMKPEEAVIRHYRDVNGGGWGNNELPVLADMGEFSMTEYPAESMNTLRENVQQRLHCVYGGMK